MDEELSIQRRLAAILAADIAGYSGIRNGRAAAILLARHGAKVGLVDVHESAAAETTRMIEAGGESLIIQADVTDVDASQTAVKKAVGRWGRLDILVNNVGTSRVRSNSEISQTYEFYRS
jgi:NAD(P)-dependent dehydrogenase (short-subunit alcohol dehydrogenase family)